MHGPVDFTLGATCLGLLKLSETHCLRLEPGTLWSKGNPLTRLYDSTVELTLLHSERPKLWRLGHSECNRVK